MPEERNKVNAMIERANNLNIDDCIECRLVGGGASILLGIYVMYAGYRRHANANRPILSRTPSVVASAFLFTLGIARLLNYNPTEMFSKTKNQSDSEGS